MKFADPLEVGCNECGERQFKSVADLLALRATCGSCRASLADVGKGMLKNCEKIAGQWEYVAKPCVDLEATLGISLPDDAGWDKIKTQAEFVEAVMTYLERTKRVNVSAEMISHAYDEPLIRAGSALPSSDADALF